MELCVIGAGYVGLIQAAGLAAHGHSVTVGERSADRVEMLDRGEAPFNEPHLADLIAGGIAAGKLRFTADNRAAVANADVVFIAVPTPEGADGSADLSIVAGVVDEVAPVLKPGAVLVFKSTVPVGSADRFAARVEELGRTDVVVASNPEFLAEGSAVVDFSTPDRIVIGVRSAQAGETLKRVYAGFEAPVVLTDPLSAEMVKYSSNAYLATRVTFGNAIANLCEYVGANVEDVLLGMGYDERIGHHFMRPGPGFGGSCFPKDTKALVAIARAAGYPFSLLEGVIEVNEAQHRRVVEKVESAAGGLAGKTVGLLGLAYKAGTADLRGSPAVAIAAMLVDRGARVRAFDPAVREAPLDLTVTESAAAAAEGADVLLVATEWPEFADLDLAALRQVMVGAALVDARNVVDPNSAARAGFSYGGIGR